MSAGTVCVSVTSDGRLRSRPTGADDILYGYTHREILKLLTNVVLYMVQIQRNNRYRLELMHQKRTAASHPYTFCNS